jgi:hypothetical protein
MMEWKSSPAKKLVFPTQASRETQKEMGETTTLMASGQPIYLLTIHAQHRVHLLSIETRSKLVETGQSESEFFLRYNNRSA